MEKPLLEPEFLRKLDRLVLRARRSFRGRRQGERKSRNKGHSVEFADHRNYSSGDDLRFLDWNIYGRLDRLFLKLFYEEENLNLYLLLDASRSMDFGDPNKLGFAKRIAAALGYVALSSHDRVDLGVIASEYKSLVSRQFGKNSVDTLFAALAKIEASGATRLEASLDRFLHRRPQPGILVLLSDFVDPKGLEGTLRTLGSRPHDVLLIQVLAPQELDPELAGHLSLVDSESPEHRVDVSISPPLLDRYRRSVASFLDETRQEAQKRGFLYTFASSRQDLETVIFTLFRQRSVLG